MIKALKRWLTASSAEQKTQLANYAGTSVAQLYQLSSGDRKASSAMAIRLEKAAARIKGKLPALTRMDLNETCRSCEYAKACAGKEKIW